MVLRVLEKLSDIHGLCETKGMIQLSKLNRDQVFVNPDLIRWIENRPDTVITFTDGHQLMVREKPDEIVQKIVQLRHAFINPQSLIKDKA